MRKRGICNYTIDTDAHGLKVSVKIRAIRVIRVLRRDGSTFSYQNVKVAKILLLRFAFFAPFAVIELDSGTEKPQKIAGH